MVTSSAILLAKFIEKGFLLRGAISFGQLYVNVENSLSLLLGKGLIDTYNQENAQEWAGCMINPEMSDVWKKLNSSWAMKSLIKSKDLIKYDIPFKKKEKQKENLYAINWVKYLSQPPKKIQYFLKKEKKKLYNEDSCIPGFNSSSAIKIDNTLTFLKKTQSIGT